MAARPVTGTVRRVRRSPSLAAIAYGAWVAPRNSGSAEGVDGKPAANHLATSCASGSPGGALLGAGRQRESARLPPGLPPIGVAAAAYVSPNRAPSEATCLQRGVGPCRHISPRKQANVLLWSRITASGAVLGDMPEEGLEPPTRGL